MTEPPIFELTCKVPRTVVVCSADQCFRLVASVALRPSLGSRFCGCTYFGQWPFVATVPSRSVCSFCCSFHAERKLFIIRPKQHRERAETADPRLRSGKSRSHGGVVLCSTSQAAHCRPDRASELTHDSGGRSSVHSNRKQENT